MTGEIEECSQPSSGAESARIENSIPFRLMQNNPQPRESILSSLRSILIVITSPLICFPAARKSTVWYFRRFWSASGVFWQAEWVKFLEIFGEDPFNLWVYGTIILCFSVYWLLSGIYLILDKTNQHSALKRCQMQPGTNEHIDNKKLMKVIFGVFVNQLVFGLPMAMLMYYTLQWRGLVPLRELPAFHRVLYELAVCILVEETTLYYSHRLLNNKHLYKYIHKQHHTWTSPYAVVAIYCHPLEHIISNLLPPCLGVCIMNSHVVTAWLWFILAILSTLNAHSEYHIPFFPFPEAHDFHHLKFGNCFGVLGILDRLHGTDTIFRCSRAYDRQTMLNFTPPREASQELSACKHELGKD